MTDSLASLTTTRLFKAQEEREARRRAFDDFSKTAQDQLLALAKSIPRLAEYEAFYAFYVLPGGSQGGSDVDLVEVKFGNAVVGAEDRQSASPKSFRYERGARLHYTLQLNGNVVVTLHDAGLDRDTRHQILIVDTVSGALRLRPWRLKLHLRALGARMAASTLDRAITPWERLLEGWLRLICWRLLVGPEGVVSQHRPAWMIAAASIVKWALTVGLSGALLAVVQSCSDRSREQDVARQREQAAEITVALRDAAALRALLTREAAEGRRIRSDIERELTALRAERAAADAAAEAP